MPIERVPEPELIMETPASVDAFDDAGEPGGPLFPSYQAIATALSRELPEGATVVDVCCGSGRLLRRLLTGRPDVRGIGVDLSTTMLERAAARLAAEGLAERVELVRADAADLDAAVAGPVAAVVSMSALHHCPTHDALVAVLTAMARVRRRDGAAVWIFDLVRPDEAVLVERIPRAYELVAGARLPAAFKDDWITSLRAGWTLDEYAAAAAAAGLDVEGREADHSQLHRTPATGSDGPAWSGPAPDDRDGQRADRLAAALGILLGSGGG